MTVASDLNPSPTLPKLPANLAKKIDAAASVEEVKQLLMSAFAMGEITMPGLENRQTALEKKTQAILELRQSNTLTEHGEVLRELQGRRIGRSEAARKYGIVSATIFHWEKQRLGDGTPMIKIYDKGLGSGSRTIIDEGHVAAMVELSRQIRTEGQRGGPLPGFGKNPPRKRKTA